MANETTDRSDSTGTELSRVMDEEAQLDAAHRYPRVFSRFIREAETIACTNQAVAKSCMYTLQRRDADGTKKNIIGPSVRLAEICAATYGNLHAGARPLDEDATTVTAQGVCWDIERNVRVVTEVKRRITTKSGKRYSDDMVIVTMNAACSIAIRNAIFRVIPRALVDSIFTAVRLTATGGKKPMEQKRAEIVAALNRLKVPTDRILLTIDRVRVEDITLEDIEALIGLGTRISEGGESVDDVFEKAVAPAGATTPAAGETPPAEGTRRPMRRPSAPAAKSEPAAKPPADDPDAADRAAAAPTAEEIAAHEGQQDPGPTDSDAPPWSSK